MKCPFCGYLEDKVVDSRESREGDAIRRRRECLRCERRFMSLSPFSSGPGMEIMKPIAAPSIGGMVSSTLHVLFMTPCLFVIAEDIRRWWHGRHQTAAVGPVPPFAAAPDAEA